MNDKLRKKRDYLFVYMMIISLVLFVSGFYVGGTVVKNKYNEEIDRLTKQFEFDKSNPTIKYLQTDFVSFYYGVLDPFNQLKIEHFAYVNKINKKDKKFDYKAKTQELLELSKIVVEKMENTIIDPSAPLLIESKNTYIESLKHYEKGISALLNKESQPEAIKRFNTSWLHAQILFYQSVVEWEKIYAIEDIEDIHVNANNLYDVSLEQWSTLTLHQKNYVISMLLEEQAYQLPYPPEDISIHIEPLLSYTDLTSLGIDRIGKAIDLFVASNALNIGDYLHEKDLYYPNVSTPLIPLFLTK